MLRIGTITEIDPDKCYARVTFLDDGIVSDFLQICVMGATGNKYFHVFDINEQVAVLMDENGEEGVIIGALYNDKNTAGGNADVPRVEFSDGSYIEYNRNTHEYNINVQGKVKITAATEVNIAANTEVKITSTAQVSITAPAVSVSGNLTVAGSISAGGGTMTMSGGNISVDGNLTANGDITGATVKQGTVELGTHTHSGVTTGGGTSGPPTP